MANHAADRPTVGQALQLRRRDVIAGSFGATLTALMLSGFVTTGTVAQAAPVSPRQGGLPPGALIVPGSDSNEPPRFVPLDDPVPAEVIPSELIDIETPFIFDEVPFTWENLPPKLKEQLAEALLAAEEEAQGD